MRSAGPDLFDQTGHVRLKGGWPSFLASPLQGASVYQSSGHRGRIKKQVYCCRRQNKKEMYKVIHYFSSLVFILVTCSRWFDSHEVLSMQIYLVQVWTNSANRCVCVCVTALGEHSNHESLRRQDLLVQQQLLFLYFFPFELTERGDGRGVSTFIQSPHRSSRTSSLPLCILSSQCVHVRSRIGSYFALSFTVSGDGSLA